MSTILIVEAVLGGLLTLVLGILMFTYKDGVTARRREARELENRLDAITKRVTILETSALTDKELRAILLETLGPLHDSLSAILRDITNIKVDMAGLPNSISRDNSRTKD